MNDIAKPGAAQRVLSVIAPCFNEEFNIPELTERVLKMFERGAIEGELVLVDDGSKDGTRRVIEEQMQKHPGLVVGCFHARNGGIAAAWKTGAAAAKGVYVCVIDADLQYQPEDILRLYRTLIETSVDVVQGWRSTFSRARDKRYYLSRGLNFLLNSAFGMTLQDNKSGFAICAREVMQDLLSYEGNYQYWQSFIMVAAHAKGYTYKEVETLFEKPPPGRLLPRQLGLPHFRQGVRGHRQGPLGVPNPPRRARHCHALLAPPPHRGPHAQALAHP